MDRNTLKKDSKVHFVGIGGIGMSALASLTNNLCFVSGSDIKESQHLARLRSQGVTCYSPHNPQYIEEGMVVVISTNIPPSNPELKRARELKCPIFHRSEFLQILSQGFTSIAVTGTHGKTTTSSLLTTIFSLLDEKPSYAVGGLLKLSGTNAEWGDSPYFIFEADESDGSLLNYTPTWSIITNVDTDHMEFYKTQEALEKVFSKFIEKADPKKTLLYADDPFLNHFCKGRLSFGFTEEASYQILKTSFSKKGSSFSLKTPQGDVHEVYTPLFGLHNILNCTAVFALANELGVPNALILAGIAAFKGTERRLNFLGNYNGMDFYDDYAHHPTEIAATLQAVNQAHSDKNILVIVQPHRFTRLNLFFDRYIEVLKNTSSLWILPIYSAGEKPMEKSALTLFEHLSTEKKECFYYPNLDAVVTEIKQLENKPDLVLTLGAGDVTEIFSLLKKTEKEKPGIL